MSSVSAKTLSIIARESDVTHKALDKETMWIRLLRPPIHEDFDKYNHITMGLPPGLGTVTLSSREAACALDLFILRTFCLACMFIESKSCYISGQKEKQRARAVYTLHVFPSLIHHVMTTFSADSVDFESSSDAIMHLVHNIAGTITPTPALASRMLSRLVTSSRLDLELSGALSHTIHEIGTHV